MATKAQLRAVKRYDAKNTVQFKLKLNKTTDSDIIGFLRFQVPNKQGFIKRIIRLEMWEAYNSCDDPRERTRVEPSRTRARTKRESE